ncbi:thermonuclease family protein [Aestuariivirga sp.]|uniref:thermonuclease family protein n=1 Tax=Aestuariivirga sp. TaxID=2650926 RepID=UPI0039198DEB
MSELSALVELIDDPDTPDDEALAANERLAAAIDAVMRGPSPLRAKLGAVRVVVEGGGGACRRLGSSFCDERRHTRPFGAHLGLKDLRHLRHDLQERLRHRRATPSRCASEYALDQKAKFRLLDLLNSGVVEVRPCGAGDVDKYGRRLRLVHVNGKSVGDTLIDQGLAWPWEGHRHKQLGSPKVRGYGESPYGPELGSIRSSRLPKN